MELRSYKRLRERKPINYSLKNKINNKTTKNNSRTIKKRKINNKIASKKKKPNEKNKAIKKNNEIKTLNVKNNMVDKEKDTVTIKTLKTKKRLLNENNKTVENIDDIDTNVKKRRKYITKEKKLSEDANNNELKIEYTEKTELEKKTRKYRKCKNIINQRNINENNELIKNPRKIRTKKSNEVILVIDDNDNNNIIENKNSIININNENDNNDIIENKNSVVNINNLEDKKDNINSIKKNKGKQPSNEYLELKVNDDDDDDIFETIDIHSTEYNYNRFSQIEDDDYLNGPSTSTISPKPKRKENIEYEIEYEVEKILDSQIIDNELMYLIEWKTENMEYSWEPYTNLNCNELLRNFHKSNPSKPKPKGFHLNVKKKKNKLNK